MFAGGKFSLLKKASETLLFSDKVRKINMFNWVQERILAITTEKIYNIKKNKVKRFIMVATLQI